MRLAWIVAASLCLTLVPTAGSAADEHGHQHAAPAAEKDAAARCEHGVKKTLCTRCNPKLAAVFKAKGDWCAEHERAESQCVLCHPELAKAGIK
jgi:hypothetical protein